MSRRSTLPPYRVEVWRLVAGPNPRIPIQADASVRCSTRWEPTQQAAERRIRQEQQAIDIGEVAGGHVRLVLEPLS
jgi:hypothetical protein